MGGMLSQPNPTHGLTSTVPPPAAAGPSVLAQTPRSYLSYFLPVTTPDLSHTHARSPGPASIAAVVRLLTVKGLPVELAERIVQDARYWTKCTRKNKRACTVLSQRAARQAMGSEIERWTSSQEEEMQPDIEREDSGLRDGRGRVWYLCSSPIGCGSMPSGSVAHPGHMSRAGQDSDREKSVRTGVGASIWPRVWLQEVVLSTDSRDQGWADDAKYYGTYENSYSWFELSLLREGREVPGSRHRMQSNVHAGQYFKSHHNVLGPGHPLVRLAREGDRVVLWARAQFPGWENHVR